MKITFCGANREVTGSCYLIESRSAKILVDCGMFQGGKFAEDKNSMEFPFNPADIQAVVVSHAHFDHVGRLPKLINEGFKGKIWCTEPTAELSMITLRDSVHLMQDEAERHQREPLYQAADVENLSSRWQTIDYHQTKEVASGVNIYLTDAGHILGSASVKVSADGQEAVFSGDLGNTPVPLLCQVECQSSADIVVIESTYGNRVHEPSNQRYTILKNLILETHRKRGVLLIPAFALERTQELLYQINHLNESKQIPTIPIYLDSPLGIAATEVFKRHSDFFNTEAKAEIAQGDEIFNFPGLTFTEHSEDSKDILNVPPPKVIIAGSGMMNGGRIMHHLKNYLGEPSTTLLIIGFQVEGSLGRKLHNKERLIHIFGNRIDVKAEIKSCGAFSGHADYPHLINWLNCFQQRPPRKIFVTHGELNSALSFSQAIEDQLGIASGVPEYGAQIDIANLGDREVSQYYAPIPAPANPS